MRRMLALGLCGTLLAAACGGGGSDDDEGAGGGVQLTTTTASDAQVEFDETATMKYAYSVGPSSFDPSKASSSFDNVALFLTYDRLVHMTPDGEAEPGLATEWEFSPDGSALTMTLRQGVTFHDGSPFNAEVAKANLDRNKAGTSKGDLAAVSSVEVVDPYTIKLNLGAPGGAIPLALSDRAGVMASGPALADPSLDLNPVGAGMYKVTQYQKDALIVYERFEDYWDPEVQKLARFELVVLPDNVAAFNAIKSGAVDAGLIVPSQVGEAEQLGFNVLEGLTLSLYHVQLNRSRPHLDNPEVRRALNMAVDREAIVAGIALDQGAASVQQFPDGYWAADPDIAPDFYPYDPDRAAEMLRAAGVPDGQQYEVIVPSTNVYPALAEAVKDMWDDVGVVMNLRPVDPVQTAPIFYSQQQGDMLVSVFGGRADPAQQLTLLFTAGPIQNPGGHTTPEIAALANEVNQPGTVEERTPAVREMVRAVAEEAMNVVLYYPTGLTAYEDGVEGLQVWLSGKPEFRGVGIAK